MVLATDRAVYRFYRKQRAKPIIVVIVLSFNDSQFGGFPMTGFSFRWYAKLMENDAVLRAFRTSLWVALITSERGDHAACPPCAK